jgi:hypothetical protein
VKAKRLDRLYDRIGRDERLRLVVAALARHDERDAQRLWEQCPRATVRGPALAFTDAFEFLQRSVVAISVLLEPKLSQLQLLETLRDTWAVLLDQIAHAAAFAVWDATEPPLRAELPGVVFAATSEPGQEMLAQLERLTYALRLEIATVANGWAQFLDEHLNIALPELLAAFRCDSAAAISAALDWEHDQAGVEDWKQFLSETHRWQLRGGPKPTVPDLSAEGER